MGRAGRHGRRVRRDRRRPARSARWLSLDGAPRYSLTSADLAVEGVERAGGAGLRGRRRALAAARRASTRATSASSSGSPPSCPGCRRCRPRALRSRARAQGARPCGVRVAAVGGPGLATISLGVWRMRPVEVPRGGLAGRDDARGVARRVAAPTSGVKSMPVTSATVVMICATRQPVARAEVVDGLERAARRPARVRPRRGSRRGRRRGRSRARTCRRASGSRSPLIAGRAAVDQRVEDQREQVVRAGVVQVRRAGADDVEVPQRRVRAGPVATPWSRSSHSPTSLDSPYGRLRGGRASAR